MNPNCPTCGVSLLQQPDVRPLGRQELTPKFKLTFCSEPCRSAFKERNE